MTAQTINTLYSVGDIVYVVIHPTADILRCVVDYVRITPITDGFSVTYRVYRTVTTTNTPTFIDYVKEDELYTFANAKIQLLDWLNEQTIKVTAMTEPVVI